ncbi:MAG: arylsulfatase, partial [Proteobacteria bacterium]|nr:arylsulfatase [Pseudomonadota bacterium]
GEVNDLSGSMPDRFQQMLDAYAAFERDNGVLPLPAGYTQRRQLLMNIIKTRYGSGILVALLTLLVLVPFVIVYRSRRPRD